MRAMDDGLAMRLAASQGGVLTRSQAIDLGHTPGSIDRRIRTARWEVVGRGVYRLLPALDERDVLQGALVALPDAVVSHTSAARLLRLEGVPAGPPTLTVVHRTTHVFEGAVVRRSTAGIPGEHRVVADSLAATTVARTIVDLAADMIPQAWDKVAQSAIVGGRCTLAQIAAVAEVVCGRGRPGSTLVRDLLVNELASLSTLERKAAAILLPLGAVAQYPAPWDPSHRLDFAFPDELLGIELDSRRWHSDGERFEADRRRDRSAQRHDWRLIRATGRDVTRDRDEFLRDVLDLLGR